MSSMFEDAKAFKLPIGDWDTTNADDMTDMFGGKTSCSHTKPKGADQEDSPNNDDEGCTFA